MEKILFITNKLFIDETMPEGGVRYCTKDYIDLLQTKFEMVLFPISFNRSLLFRIKSKLGVDVLEDHNPKDFKDALFAIIEEKKIKKIFLNLSTASFISQIIKEKFGDSVKVILCSHGIEGGDFLHNSVRFKALAPKIHQSTSPYRLGKILQKELIFRINYIDLVLTVSEIEVAIEKWIGAKKVFFVPRIFAADFISWKPEMGKIGFIGDLNHYPNYYGLLKLCESIAKKNIAEKVAIQVVGKESKNLQSIIEKYPFVHALGYLDNDQLKIEAATWMYYLNLVFYYSKGVSTKLAKGMNWGLPIISTEAGNRGYNFNKGAVITVNDVNEIAEVIVSRFSDINKLENDKKNVELAVETSDKYEDIMRSLYPVIEAL